MANAAPNCISPQLKCPICLRRFRGLKTLDCLHSFCMNCLQELGSKRPKAEGTIICPVCQEVTAIPDSGLPGLASRFFQSALVDGLDRQEKLADTPTRDECEEGVEAVSRCLDCGGNICQWCQDAHQQLKSTKKHNILKVGVENQGISSKDPKENVAPHCGKHSDEKLSLYCNTCNTLACLKCIAKGHPPEEHKYSNVADAIQLLRRNVQKVQQTFKNSSKQFQIAQGSTELTRNRLRESVARACCDISAKEEEEVAKIRDKSRILREKVIEVGQEREEKIEEVLGSNRDKMDLADKTMAAVSAFVQRGNDFGILHLKPEIMDNLGSSEGMRLAPAEPSLSFIRFKCHDALHDGGLGEIIQEEKWKLQRQFGKGTPGSWDFDFARGVACFSNGDIVVADTGKNQVLVSTSCGSYKSKVGHGVQEGMLHAPWGVAVTPNDLLLITDKKNVKVYDCNLQLIRQFTPSLGDTDGHSKSRLTGIAVNKQNQIAVADKGRGIISLHNLDGSLIATIPHDMVGNFLAVSDKGSLVFTSSKEHAERRLLSIDLTGETVFGVAPSFSGQAATPVGVCCNEDGNIYVSVHRGFLGTCEVHQFDPQGVYVGFVAHGLYTPLDMTFTPSGDLVVADRTNVKIYRRI